jgi:hypothetical protein
MTIRGITETRLAELRRREDAWSMRRFDAEERFGLDSYQERRALERATDYAVEAEMVEADLDDQ